jgi:predicted negative regulator of RcsB-dependent stress response
VYGDGDILVGRAGINQVQKFWQHERRKLFCQTAIIANLCVLCWNYYGQRRFTFRQEKSIKFEKL